jgi:hypothetical protein
MNTENTVAEFIAATNPLGEDRAHGLEARSDHIWSNIEQHIGWPDGRPRWRLIVGSASLTTLVAIGLVLVSIFVSTPSMSAAAAQLAKAADSDAAAASLPSIALGQFYYQDSAVSMVCQFSSPSMPANESLTYVSDGTMQSWSNQSGQGQVAITPSAVDANGSHFATAQDQAEWLAAGSPFIPCALGGPSNELNGNPANANTIPPYGGFASSGTFYGGFGFTLASNSVTTDLSSATNVNNLPTNVAVISSMLANGEINLDGSASTAPQACPADSAPGASPGCSTAQQLAVIEQLLQLPDASAKLGAVLYQVMAQMPGATLSSNVTDSLGQIGEAVTVPTFEDEEFEVILNATTGALLSCSELVASNTGNALTTPSAQAYEPVGKISYGPIGVVQGIGSLPS